METTDVTERPTHRIARETYTPDRLPEFDVYSAVIDVTADTLARGVEA
jgi:hypothetical protein